MEANIDDTTNSVFFEFPVGETTLHIEGHYGQDGETVYSLAAWLGNYILEKGYPVIPDDAPYIWREVAEYKKESGYYGGIDKNLVEQLVKDILRYV